MASQNGGSGGTQDNSSMASLQMLLQLRAEVCSAKVRAAAANAELCLCADRLIDEVQKIISITQGRRGSDDSSSNNDLPSPPIISEASKRQAATAARLVRAQDLTSLCVATSPPQSPFDPDFGPRHDSISSNVMPPVLCAATHPPAQPQREDSISSLTSSPATQQLRSCIRSPTTTSVNAGGPLSPRQQRLRQLGIIKAKSWGSSIQFIGGGDIIDEAASMRNGFLVVTSNTLHLTNWNGEVSYLKVPLSRIVSIDTCESTERVCIKTDEGRWIISLHADTKSSSVLRLLDCVEAYESIKVRRGASIPIDPSLQKYLSKDKAEWKMQHSNEVRRASVNENANTRDELDSEGSMGSPKQKAQVPQRWAIQRVTTGTRLHAQVPSSPDNCARRGFKRVSTGTQFIKLNEGSCSFSHIPHVDSPPSTLSTPDMNNNSFQQARARDVVSPLRVQPEVFPPSPSVLVVAEAQSPTITLDLPREYPVDMCGTGSEPAPSSPPKALKSPTKFSNTEHLKAFFKEMKAARGQHVAENVSSVASSSSGE